MEFFNETRLRFNPQFTDETAACMVVSEDIYAMLLTHAKFKEFTPKAICDATKSTEVLVACPWTAASKWRRWFARRSPLAGQPMPSPRTTASCISMASRIPMGISGN